MKILVAEDDENSRKLLETVFDAQGYRVVSFENGLKALEYLESARVDLIISDILMPEMDGYGLCKAVKQNINLQKIPFIFYTATYTSSQDERFALALGANKFLIKPMLMEELLTIVAETLQANLYTKPVKGRGLYRSSPSKLDKQHADRVRAKLDEKIVELNEERKKLIENEVRLRDFAEASADWFWETNDQLIIEALTGGNEWFNLSNLEDLANICQNQTSNEVLKALQTHQKITDLVVHTTNGKGKPTFTRISGKPVFNNKNAFIGYRGVGRDVTDTISLNRRVEYLATHDELTGLPNRSMFRQRLEHAIAKAERVNSQVLLLFFDLDHFKQINDTLGHDAGDQLLVLATKRIAERARSTDILCRLGGDEFVMVMENASPQDGHRLVRDIIAAFAVPFELKEQRIYSTVSIGVSVYPDDTTDPQTLLLYSDLAMYRAKQNGRNDFEFYTIGLNYIAHQWLDMEHDIRKALKENQMFVVFQPQVDHKSQKLFGMETLLRWRHPERGLIPPMEFIKIAEQSSLINDIGEFVLEESCKQIRDWLDKGYQVPRVSVNISARHLRSVNLSKSLTAITAKYEVPPELICIEITEHALLEYADAVKKNMRHIKDNGYKVSLDDFGVGHSSLLYLKRWSVDEVKIDRVFVENIVSSEDDRLIVKAIIALGDALGLNLVGEGVESQLQSDILAENGCKIMQGYLYSLPISATEMQTWLKKKA
ncbi:MAG: EAL domain-containing protein [Methylophilaceae bacterium]